MKYFFEIAFVACEHWIMYCRGNGFLTEVKSRFDLGKEEFDGHFLGFGKCVGAITTIDIMECDSLLFGFPFFAAQFQRRAVDC